MTLDPVQLTADLIRCPSVTPAEAGALVLLERVLSAAGFACTRVDRNGTPNLFARWGAKGAKTFGFNGHTDVVPVGDAAAWTQEPFSGAVINGVLWGRGATDMKSGVAAFVAAAVDFVTTTPPEGAIILTITGDEEGPGKDGTLALLDWMKAEGEAMSVCLVGEPTCPETLGDMMKIGRRGSMTFYLEVEGVQGHSAYPHRAKNPLHALVELLGRMTAEPLDRGTEHFEPSTLQITTIDCGNPANNVIPAKARATVNIRFNDAHSSAKIEDWARGLIAEIEAETGTRVSLCTEVSGESFLTPPGDFVELVSRAVVSETGVVPVLSTSGGTSDARFVKDHCPVLEFGLVGKTMHQVDERIEVAQITRLKAIYARCLRDFFA
ncbi:succinyl-diaminopimelate desuccinylase [Rhodobacter capsulatus]|uniref:succinyl-diaminopimelate desuccinylase n=1 Tax=Rhodobacter capsulatus TaxID=1061 RepID=UPI0003D3871F|nr:succinyl-diaminopimelate desuccinylase [Rhodobacter capsulatus]ETD80900.1 succinyl-diaminopimelate desuccinylase [Rhodobacter capsulatus YW1]